MITAETIDKTELLKAIDQAVSQLLKLISLLDETKINTIPYQDSWTAAQLFDHVTKSMIGMAKVMRSETKPAQRDANAKIAELRKIFLDFTTKLKSPEFITPFPGPFKKIEVVDALNNAFEMFKLNTNRAELTEIVEGLPLGTVSKLEILHFTLYHTQRHLHQLEKINSTLNG